MSISRTKSYRGFLTIILLSGVADAKVIESTTLVGFGEAKYSFINYTKNMIDRINKRFSKLSNNKNETRVWSIEIYESIVAFCVNKKKANEMSVPTDNGGENDKSADYRYEDNQAIKNLDYINKLLKYIPGFKFIIRQLKFFIIRLSCKSKVFFK